MIAKRSYLAAAFNARPLGMPVPPNWFGVAAFALLGALVNPALWLIGLGLEGLYLFTLSRHPRFRATVDAEQGQTDWHSRYAQLSSYLSRRMLATSSPRSKRRRTRYAICWRAPARPKRR